MKSQLMYIAIIFGVICGIVLSSQCLRGEIEEDCNSLDSRSLVSSTHNPTSLITPTLPKLDIAKKIIKPAVPPVNPPLITPTLSKAKPKPTAKAKPSNPSVIVAAAPTKQPLISPPSKPPSARPTFVPSQRPTFVPSQRPTYAPSARPTFVPSIPPTLVAANILLPFTKSIIGSFNPVFQANTIQLSSLSNPNSISVVWGISNMHTYDRFSVFFEFSIEDEPDGEMFAFFGASDRDGGTLPQGYNENHNSVMLRIHPIFSNDQTRCGVFLHTSYGVLDNGTIPCGAGLTKVNVDYLKGNLDTWTVIVNDEKVMNASDKTNTAWMGYNSGNQWGFGSNIGMKAGTFKITNIGMETFGISSTFVGYYWRTWIPSNEQIIPPEANVLICYTGFLDPIVAVNSCQKTMPHDFQGLRGLALGGETQEGYWTSARIDALIAAINPSSFFISPLSWDFLMFFLDIGDAGLSLNFKQLFLEANRYFVTVLTVAHTAPTGFKDSIALMKSLLETGAGLSIISNRLYSVDENNITQTDFNATEGVAWADYSNAAARFFPTLKDSQAYVDAIDFFNNVVNPNSRKLAAGTLSIVNGYFNVGIGITSRYVDTSPVAPLEVAKIGSGDSAEFSLDGHVGICIDNLSGQSTTVTVQAWNDGPNAVYVADVAVIISSDEKNKCIASDVFFNAQYVRIVNNGPPSMLIQAYVTSIPLTPLPQSSGSINFGTAVGLDLWEKGCEGTGTIVFESKCYGSWDLDKCNNRAWFYRGIYFEKAADCWAVSWGGINYGVFCRFKKDDVCKRWTNDFGINNWYSWGEVKDWGFSGFCGYSGYRPKYATLLYYNNFWSTWQAAGDKCPESLTSLEDAPDSSTVLGAYVLEYQRVIKPSRAGQGFLTGGLICTGAWYVPFIYCINKNIDVLAPAYKLYQNGAPTQTSYVSFVVSDPISECWGCGGLQGTAKRFQTQSYGMGDGCSVITAEDESKWTYIFQPACNFHDSCLACGKNYGFDEATCHKAFYLGMLNINTKLYDNNVEGTIVAFKYWIAVVVKNPQMRNPSGRCADLYNKGLLKGPWVNRGNFVSPYPERVGTSKWMCVKGGDVGLVTITWGFNIESATWACVNWLPTSTVCQVTQGNFPCSANSIWRCYLVSTDEYTNRDVTIWWDHNAGAATWACNNWLGTVCNNNCYSGPY